MRPSTLLPGSRIAIVVVTIVAGLASALVAAPVLAADDTVLQVSGSPFLPDGDGRRERVRIELEIGQAAEVAIEIRDVDERSVRRIVDRAFLEPGTHAWTWDGRRASGRRLPPAAYRVRATIAPRSGPSVSRARWVTIARKVPYPAAPGAIVVALDAGHGGPAAGAVWRKRHEDDVNLDIALRLEAMLKGAGVGVVMTRRRDRLVSPAGLDITGDRRYTRLDELVARNDIANVARADVHIAIHNNASTCHCTRGTEMFTRHRGGWASEGRRLARLILQEHLRHLDALPGFRPRRRGVSTYPFKALKRYHPRSMPRPSLQPSVLGESLFLDRPVEHRVLASRKGRRAIAAAYFDGIARYLARRRYGVRYDILSAPSSVSAGSSVAVTVRVTNTGHRASASWRIKARVVDAVRRYDGRPRRGRVRASAPIPDRLEPGESAVVTIGTIPMRTRSGRWLIKLDIGLPNGRQLSQLGVVGPQLLVRTVVG